MQIGRAMEDEKAQKEAIEEISRRFEALLSGSALSDAEKRSLSNEMLKIIFGSIDEVVQ
jgi:hypothetical protein